MPSRNMNRAGTLLMVALAGVAVDGTAAAQVVDPVVFSFATVGDNRQDPASPDPTTLIANPNPTTQGGAPSLTGTLLPQDAMYLQNSTAWSTIQSGIQAQNPNLLFFNGDMIYGYGRPILPTAWTSLGGPGSWYGEQAIYPDAFFEYLQYAYWRGTVSTLFSSGTYVMPVPGNHETQCSSTAAPYNGTNGAPASNPNCNTKKQGNLTGKTAYADNENAFRANMSDLIQDLVTNYRFSNVTGFFPSSPNGLTAATAPQPGGNNGPITSPQNDLTYSFDIVVQASPLIQLHFAVIDTDPAGADSTAPADWLAADFAAAKARGASNFFVFGHKPAFTYNYAAATGGSIAVGGTPGPSGLDANTTAAGTATINGVSVSYNSGPASLKAFWSVVTEYGATYFCGHEHTVNVAQYPDPTGTYAGTPYHVIVGSGGSPFDDKLINTPCTSNALGAAGNCSEPALTNPFDRYYAWALVQVHQSGAVTLHVSGFSDQFGVVQDLGEYDVSSLQLADAAAKTRRKK